MDTSVTAVRQKNIKSMTINTDCRHFRGDIPCTPHKQHGVHCDGCDYYDQVTENILIIKLGAAGDVLRTTPLLHQIRSDHPSARIWWLTYTPDLVPKSHVDRILKWNSESLTLLANVAFTRLINLDKDHFACALANRIAAEKKFGYLLDEKLGITIPANENAEAKYLTGIFDDISKANTRSYPEEMFEICGYEFQGQRYILDRPVHKTFTGLDTSKPIIGLNTGAGMRWTSRLWAEERWAELARSLTNDGYTVVLLGGPDEDSRNRSIQAKSGNTAIYLGTFALTDFIALIDQCSVIVSGITMAFHIALALEKRIVVINNIFNKYEFGDLYGQGELIEPVNPCQCYFRGVCINKDYFCLDSLEVTTIHTAVRRQLASI
jgi:heptosyltransferase-2